LKTRDYNGRKELIRLGVFNTMILALMAKNLNKRI